MLSVYKQKKRCYHILKEGGIQMLQAWLLRPSPSGKNRLAEFKQDNIIAIGWPDVGNLSGKNHDQIKSSLAAPPYEYTSIKLGTVSAMLDIFVNRMNVDDLVLVPDGNDINFFIVQSEYFFDTQHANKDTSEYPHQRTISWLSSKQRKNLPIELRKSLKIPHTTADLSKHYDVIKALAYDEDLPQQSSETEEESTVSVDYPIRPNLNISLRIPKGITKTEAERLGDFIKTIYF